MPQYLPAGLQEPGTTRTLLAEESGSQVNRTLLDNGLRIITERMPGASSVAFGIWVGAGSRDESQLQHGAAHYLEHLLFKATARRDAFAVNAEIDAVGGEMNAFTTRETTCFYAHVLDTDAPVAVDVVSDVVMAALMREQDVESERAVVLEEIAMHFDDPADVALDRCYTQVLPDKALARPILGTTQSIEALRPRQIRRFYADHYRPPAMVVAAAGALEHHAIVEMVRRATQSAGITDQVAPPAPIRSTAGARARRRPDVVLRRPTEQTHIVVAGASLARNDPDRYALAVLNAVLGGGMASRLFTRVREELGLAYSVFSFATPFADTGVFGVYAGTRPRNMDAAIAVIRDEIALAAAKGLRPDEVARGKGSVRGSRILSLEDPFSRMSRLGQSELVVGELPSLDEIRSRIEAVTVAEVAAVAARILPACQSLTVVGPVPEGWNHS